MDMLKKQKKSIDEKMKFFVTSYGGSNDKLAGYNISLNHLMISAGSYYRKNGFSKPSPVNHKELFIDSGGYQLVSRFGDFPFSPQEYIKYINELNPTFFASMDLPCDDRIKHSEKELSNKNRIDKTVEYAREIVDCDVNSVFVPVIQGFTKEEYLDCIDKMKEYGLIKDYMGVGSLCIRSSIDNIQSIVKFVKRNLPDYVKLHCFGIKLSAIENQGIWPLIHSIDTMAWQYGQKFGSVYAFTGARLVQLNCKERLKSVEQKYVSLNSYLQYFNFLKNKYENKQTCLEIL